MASLKHPISFFLKIEIWWDFTEVCVFSTYFGVSNINSETCVYLGENLENKHFLPKWPWGWPWIKTKINNCFVIKGSVFYEHYAVKSIQLSLKLCQQCSIWFTLVNANKLWPSKWPWEKTDCNPILIFAILWSLGGI